jgi:hypothetical protein
VKPVELFNLVLGTCVAIMLVCATMIVVGATLKLLAGGGI